MKYVGSKNRISKDLCKIIQSYITDNTEMYIEPFVGGANVIDKIKCKKRIGCDINKYLISLLRVVRDNPEKLPKTITEDAYREVRENKIRFDDWYVGLVGFCGSYGAKWFGGFARGFKSDGKTERDIPNEGIRNLLKQSGNLKGIIFKHCSYLEIPISKIKNSVIYCDPPYRGVTGYKDSINYKEFYEWCKQASSNNNILLVSEYNMPSDFECIWKREHETTLKVKEHEKRVEKLFIYRG